MNAVLLIDAENAFNSINHKVMKLICPCYLYNQFTAPKMKFSITGFFSKYDQIRRELLIWSHLLKKSVMENFIFCSLILIQLHHRGYLLSVRSFYSDLKIRSINLT